MQPTGHRATVKRLQRTQPLKRGHFPLAHDVFISHSSKDKTVADAVCAAVEQAGIRCWIAPRDILPGADWGGSIISGIKGSRAMVLVFSGAANASTHIPREVERAVRMGIPVIPFRIESVLPEGGLEYHLGTVHWLDAMSPPLEAHLRRLQEILSSILHPPLRPDPPVQPPAPEILEIPPPRAEVSSPSPTVKVAPRTPEAATASAVASITVRHYADLFDPRRYGTNWRIALAYAIAGLLMSFMLDVWNRVTHLQAFDTPGDYAMRSVVLTFTGAVLVFLLHRARPAAVVVLVYTLAIAALRAGLLFNSIELETIRQFYMDNLSVFITQWLAYPALESLALIVAIRRTGGTLRGLMIAFLASQIIPSLGLPLLGDVYSYDTIPLDLGFGVVDGVMLGWAFWIAINSHLRRQGYQLAAGRILPT